MRRRKEEALKRHDAGQELAPPAPACLATTLYTTHMERERVAGSRAADYSSSAAVTRLRRELTLAGVRRAALSRTALAVGLLAALAGAGLGFGIMAYEAIVNGVDYTAQSWLLIAPVWGALAALWLLVRRWPIVAALPFGALALYAAYYFSDVYGQYPAGLVVLLALPLVLLPPGEQVERGATSGPA